MSATGVCKNGLVDGYNNHRLIANDMGIVNPAICFGDPLEYMGDENDTYRPEAQRANFMVRRRDGRVFEYEEGEAPMRIMEWVGEHAHLIRDCELYVIEKQMTYNKSEKERGCIVLENTLHTTLLSLKTHGLWDGEVGVIRPTEWKDWFNIPRSPPHLNRDDAHAFQKSEGIKAFVKRFGQEMFDQLAKRWGKVDDVVESILIWVFAAENFNRLKKRFRYESSHLWVFNTDKDRVGKRDREEFSIGEGILSDNDETKYALKPEELSKAWDQHLGAKQRRKNKN